VGLISILLVFINIFGMSILLLSLIVYILFGY